MSIFIAKYSPERSLDWVKVFNPEQASSNTTSSGLSLGLDESNNVYVTGALHGAVDFGAGVVGDLADDPSDASTLPVNVFLASYDTNGGLRWASVHRSTLETTINRGTAIAVGSAVYIAGDGGRGLDFGNGTIGNLQDSRYMFLAAFDRATGALVWSRGMANDGPDTSSRGGVVTGLEVDSQERLYASGWWRGGLDFGNGRVASGILASSSTSSPAETGFLASYTGSAGVLRWARSQNDNAYCMTNAVAIDESNNVYAAGTFVRPTDFGGGVRDSGADLTNKLFIVSFDDAGNHRFDLLSRSNDGGASASATGIEIRAENLYASAYYQGTVDLFGNTISSEREADGKTPSADAALISYDLAKGELNWARHFGTGQLDIGSQIKLTGASAVIGLSARGSFDVDGVLVEPQADATSVLIQIDE